MLPESEVSSLCTDLEGFYRHHRLENWKNNLKNSTKVSKIIKEFIIMLKSPPIKTGLLQLLILFNFVRKSFKNFI